MMSTESKVTNQRDDWNESSYFVSVSCHIKLPCSSHIQRYVLCRRRATPLSLLSKGSHKYYMIHVMYILTEAKLVG